MVKRDYKILIVYNSKALPARRLLAKNHCEALRSKGLTVVLYEIEETNFWDIIKHVCKIRKVYKSGNFDIAHTLFGYSGFICSLAFIRPIIVAIMGVDLRLEKCMLPITKFFTKFCWDATVVKSTGMYDAIDSPKTYLIPNGIDLSRFSFIDREIARKRVEFSSSAHVLWVSDPLQKEKNFSLAREAFAHITTDDVELTVVNNVELDKVPYYYYAADVLLVTSKWEGSPNVVKEAMACCLPIVSTDVGDIAAITNKTKGCFIVDDDPETIAIAIDAALNFGKRTDGREKVEKLDIHYVANQIISVYDTVYNKRNKQTPNLPESNEINS